jgi:hypothetical protein
VPNPLPWHRQYPEFIALSEDQFLGNEIARLAQMRPWKPIIQELDQRIEPRDEVVAATVRDAVVDIH